MLFSRFIIAFLIAFIGGCATSSFNQTVLPLSAVMASPDKYSGHIVKVKGFLTLDFEGTALYPSRNDCLNNNFKNGIWLNIKLIMMRQNYKRCGVAWAVGTYQRPEQHGSGHFGGWTGELISITSFGQENREFHAPTVIKTKLSDMEIEKLLIGTWTSSPFSPDYSKFKVPELITFDVNGVSIDNKYSDTECKKVDTTTIVNWRIENRMLSLATPNKSDVIDLAILNINTKELVYYDIDDGMTFHLVRSTACPTLSNLRANYPLPANHPFIGTWRVEQSDLKCIEEDEIHSDGTTSVTSGQEHSESEFLISQMPDPNGFYKWIDKITKNNDLPDCWGSTTPVGDVAVNFVRIDQDGVKLRLCRDESTSSCYLEFQRAK